MENRKKIELTKFKQDTKNAIFVHKKNGTKR